MQKIYLIKLREDIRATHADYPTNGDEMLEYQARNAEVIADLSVMIVRENDRGTALQDQLGGVAAVISAPLLNIIRHNDLPADAVIDWFAEQLRINLISGGAKSEKVELHRVEVGDA